MNRSTIIVAFCALVFLGGQCALAQSGYNLFQKGLVQERVKGDLDEAIKVYERIIVKFPNNRPRGKGPAPYRPMLREDGQRGGAEGLSTPHQGVH
jgi:hypothetical protein